METVIKSRYGVPRTFRKLDSTTYLVWGESEFMRFGEGFIDYEGGPFISVGEPLVNYIRFSRKVITKIEPAEIKELSNCYKLTVA